MKIVFILDTIDAPHILKRITEFINQQYQVEVYGFKHFREKSLNPPSRFDIKVIGEINQANYWLRIMGMIKGIRRVLKETKGQDVLYYLPSLDVAMFFRMLCSAPYAYEESDLKHTYVNSKFIQGVLEKIDKRVIKKSVVAAFTSEGFVKYHFGDNPPKNICYVFNRLNKGILSLPEPGERDTNINNLKFAFVGKASFRATYAFAKHIVDNYKQHEMHFYGVTDARDDDKVNYLTSHSNFFLHGRFNNPDDLPNIYKDVDIVTALYDVDSINVLYAEPNKLYESIYFRRPILVSSGTYLAEKVRMLGIGFDIDAMDPTDIDSFIQGLTENAIKERVYNANKIEKHEAINDNSALFEKVKEYVDIHYSNVER